MRLLAALIVLSCAAISAPAYACDTIVGWVGVPICSEAEDPPVDIPVPDVVGEANSAAADAILEGDLLDLGNVSVRCSAAAADEIISQNPTAGTLVAEGTLVDVLASSGVVCSGGRGRLRIGLGNGL